MLTVCCIGGTTAPLNGLGDANMAQVLFAHLHIVVAVLGVFTLLRVCCQRQRFIMRSCGFADWLDWMSRGHGIGLVCTPTLSLNLVGSHGSVHLLCCY